MFQSLKYFFLFLLTFLLVTQIAYAKTELVLIQNQVSFSIEQTQNFKSLEKEVQPNIGFLKEKSRFVLSESVSAQNQHGFSEYFASDLAKAGVKSADNLVDLVDDAYKVALRADLNASSELLEALGKNSDLVDAWKPIAEAGHDASKNVDLLKKINADGFDAVKVGGYLKGQKAPAGFEGKVNYSVTKNNVKVDYDANGFPKFEQHSPGEGYLYQPGTDKPLIGKKAPSGSNADIKNANKAMSKRFQGNTSNQFKWDGKSNNFEIIDSNGNTTKYTWHHHQDGKSMFPVPSKIHNTREGGFKHSGGSTIIRDGLEGLFGSPQF